MFFMVCRMGADDQNGKLAITVRSKSSLVRLRMVPWHRMLRSPPSNTSVCLCIRNSKGYKPVMPNYPQCPEAEKIQPDHMASPDMPLNIRKL